MKSRRPKSDRCALSALVREFCGSFNDDHIISACSYFQADHYQDPSNRKSISRNFADFPNSFLHICSAQHSFESF